LTASFTKEVDSVKESLDTNLSNPIDAMKDDLDELSGPIKRQM
jgi:hypothetical protein